MEEKLTTGIAASHAYSILEVREVQDDEGTEWCLFKMRNPWGNHEWNGLWSDKSEIWTEELIQELEVED
jgi:hypothetical protein